MTQLGQLGEGRARIPSIGSIDLEKGDRVFRISVCILYDNSVSCLHIIFILCILSVCIVSVLKKKRNDIKEEGDGQG